jgi:ribosomal-protein-alanine N-acetyltransferase
MSLKIIHIGGHAAYKSDMALALFNLDQSFFPTPWALSSWQNLFGEGAEKNLFVVYEEETLIGFSLFDVASADSFAHLLKILINPEYRGKGTSKLLLADAVEFLKCEGITHFFLEVEAENYAAQKLYLSQGFIVIHRKKDFYGNGRDALIMTLDFN